jgi:surface antigen
MSQYPCFAQAPDSACPATPHYPARECTSYADWRASLILGHTLPDWGNGGQWAGNAKAAGFVVNGTPAVNSIMALAPNTNGAGPKGHVAFVVSVEPVTVVVQEYNFKLPPNDHQYDERDARIAGAQFIHLPIPPTPPEDDDLTPEQATQLQQIWSAIFEPTQVGGTTGYPAYAPGNNIDIIRRKLNPYNEPYPPPNTAVPPAP